MQGTKCREAGAGRSENRVSLARKIKQAIAYRTVSDSEFPTFVRRFLDFTHSSTVHALRGRNFAGALDP
jgi:hypothetical protein